MSNKEETNDGKRESESLDSEIQEVADNSNESPEAGNAAEPSPKSTSTLYGTRKRRPGAQSAPHAKTLDQIRGAYNDDDIIEMDDLPTRSNAPTNLIEDERPSERQRRDRPERRERSREQDESEAEASSETSEMEAYPTDESTGEPQDETPRPQRFAEVEKSKRAGSRQIEEFSPTKDGKRAAPRKRAKPESRDAKPSAVAGEKKGLFGWIKSVFSSESEESETPQKPRPKSRKPNQRPRRGGQNRSREDGSKSEHSGGGQRGRRPRRNRRPRGEASSNEGNRRGNRPRRRRRPQGERKQSSSE